MIEFHNRSSTAMAIDFKEIASERALQLLKFNSSIIKIKIEILEGLTHKIKAESHEVAIHVRAGNKIYKASASGENNLIAFDKAYNIIEAQLRRDHSIRSTSASRRPGIKKLPPPPTMNRSSRPERRAPTVYNMAITNATKIISTLFILLSTSVPISAEASSIKCLTKPAVEASLRATQIALEGLNRSLPKQLDLARKIKGQIPQSLKEMERSYATYKSNPTPENKKIYDEKNLAYKSLSASYDLQYELYLGQKRRIPELQNKVSSLQGKVKALSKECSK